MRTGAEIDEFAILKKRDRFVLRNIRQPLDFELPPLDPGGSWRRWIDTYLDSPQDIVPWETAPVVPSHTYRTGPRSIVVLWANGTNIARKHNDRATGSHL